MKKYVQSFVMLLAVLMVPASAGAAYVQLADGVYQDGTTLYIGSGVTSLGSLQLNPSVIYCYATIPPSLASNTFTGYNAALHVPKTAMVSYFSALYWYNFNNITADAVEPQSVTLSKTSAEVATGETMAVTATVEPSNATPFTLYWSSTNSSVATVSGGLVTAIAAGECDIIANCVDKQAVCHVTVIPQPVTITLDQHVARLLPNHTLTLTATCVPAATDLSVTTSDPEVAIPRYVNGTIMVVGVGEGTATITVSTADGWCNPDACEVTVYTDLGDANCDGFVDIDDVTALIARVLGTESSPFKQANADVKSDGLLDIDDVTLLISYILNGFGPWSNFQYELIFVPGDPAGNQTVVSTSDMMSKDVINVSSTYAAFAAKQYRFGKNAVTTFKSEIGKIVKIRFICTNDNPAKGFGANDGMTYDDPNGTWEGTPSPEVVITCKDKQVRATQIIFTIDASGVTSP